MKYEIDFECYWCPDRYPVSITCGTYHIEANSDLEVLFEIRRKFLQHPAISSNYYFLISNNEIIFEIKSH